VTARRIPAYAGLALLALLFVALVAAVISVLTFEGPTERERIPGAQAGVPRLAAADVGRDSSTIFLADAKDPNKRRVLLQVQQEHDFGIRASASRDGKKIAYTVLEPGARQMEGGASLWLLDLPSGQAKRLSTSVDLRQTPVWSKKGSVLAARRTTEDAGSVRTELLLFDVKSGSERVLLTDDQSLSAHPFDTSTRAAMCVKSRA
jgi:Tol biopolymer transport system component